MYDIYHIIKALIIKIINAPNSPEQETKSLFRNKSTLIEKWKKSTLPVAYVIFILCHVALHTTNVVLTRYATHFLKSSTHRLCLD